MLTFDNVKRSPTITAVPFDYTYRENIEHWMEEFGVTGWDICDRRTVLDRLGEDTELELTAPTMYNFPGNHKTDNVMYFVSFCDAADIRAKIDEIITSQENIDWEIARAAEACMEADPSLFDWRKNLDYQE